MTLLVPALGLWPDKHNPRPMDAKELTLDLFMMTHGTSRGAKGVNFFVMHKTFLVFLFFLLLPVFFCFSYIFPYNFPLRF